MAEYKCGKQDSCKYGNNCPFDLYPNVSYLCFAHNKKWAEQWVGNKKEKENGKNNTSFNCDDNK